MPSTSDSCSFFFTYNFALVILLLLAAYQVWSLCSLTRMYDLLLSPSLHISLSLSLSFSLKWLHLYLLFPSSFDFIFFFSFRYISFVCVCIFFIYGLIRLLPNAINNAHNNQMLKCMLKNANHKRTQISINIQCRDAKSITKCTKTRFTTTNIATIIWQ